MEKYHPAPWTLSGKGYVLLYRFSKAFAEEKIKVPAFLEGRFAGGFGALMLVNYNTSDAGPYDEMLLIPGKFKHRDTHLNTISNIYVSTMASVDNGKKNWGIPKALADFSFTSTGSHTEQVTVSSGNTPIADFTLTSGRLSFPVSTKRFPFPLVQHHDGNYFYTTFHGSGTGRFAKLQEVCIHSQHFPDISGFKPLVVIKIEPFQITFPAATVTAADTSL